MTDKQLETKKEEFYKGFVEPEYYNIDDELIPNSEYGEWLRDPDDVWQWIEKLVEHCYIQGKIEGYKECLEELN